ncbi:DUF4328 domain-containing protein [Streptomyces sp. NPDC002773]|uniref:DUF4328 domain-containing protein n=1 Tax=Streptomyces sp. NPDC002773 TaxID=3154430 RepID=UPI003323F4AB
MLRNPVGLSYAVVALLASMILSDVFLFFSVLDVWFLTAGGTEKNMAGFSHLGVDVTTWGQTLLSLPTQIVFIIWFFRVRRNAEVFASDLHRGGPGWAIGAWFVPIAQFWWPRSVAAGTWRASRRDPYGDGKEEPLALLNWWWAVWIFSVLFGTFASAVYDDADRADEFRAGAGLLVAWTVLDTVAAVLAILFVRRLTSMQHRKATGMIPAAQ